MSTTASVPAKPVPPPPLTYRILFSPLALIGMALGAFFTSVVVEWIGMLFGVWSPSGSEHARLTLAEDISYLNSDFTNTFLGLSPVELAAYSASSLSGMIADFFVGMNLGGVESELRSMFDVVKSLINRGRAPTGDLAATASPIFTSIMTNIGDYLDAAIYSIQIVIVRVVVALLTLPAYVLICLAAFLDGVVARDVRRFTGANESAFAYHRYRPWAKRFFVLGWYTYISWPASIHPNVVFIPSALLCGWAIFNTAKWFKKFF